MDKIYDLWFSLCFSPANDRAIKLYSQISSVKEIFQMKPNELRDMKIFTEKEIEILKSTDFSKAEEVIKQMQALNGDIITQIDERYPMRLKEIFTPPILLYSLGKLPDVNNSLPISLIGTRKPSIEGINAAKFISAGLVQAGVVVVSGMAQGLDAECNAAAVEAGGQTIAVLGSGVDVVYPANQRKLYEAIINGGGAVISEYPPTTKPIPRNFPVRNRIIAGISAGLCVIEANIKSGTMITVASAIDENRDIFAVPGSIFSKTAEGTNHLIKQGAKAVLAPSDILEEYYCIENYNFTPANNMVAEAPTKLTHRSKVSSNPNNAVVSRDYAVPQNINENQKCIFKELINGAMTPDEISDKTAIPIHKILIELTELEILGIVFSKEGSKYTL